MHKRQTTHHETKQKHHLTHTATETSLVYGIKNLRISAIVAYRVPALSLSWPVYQYIGQSNFKPK
jgi:hypothetical protein